MRRVFFCLTASRHSGSICIRAASADPEPGEEGPQARPEGFAASVRSQLLLLRDAAHAAPWGGRPLRHRCARAEVVDAPDKRLEPSHRRLPGFMPLGNGYVSQTVISALHGVDLIESIGCVAQGSFGPYASVARPSLFPRLSPTQVGLEACGSLTSLGSQGSCSVFRAMRGSSHSIPPQYVKPGMCNGANRTQRMQ